MKAGIHTTLKIAPPYLANKTLPQNVTKRTWVRFVNFHFTRVLQQQTKKNPPKRVSDLYHAVIPYANLRCIQPSSLGRRSASTQTTDPVSRTVSDP